MSCGGTQDRIPLVIDASGQERRVIWALWLAAALVAAAGLMPFVFGGTSSRIASAIIPFGIGAIALAACAVFHSQGRTTLSVIYFVAGLAIVYGLLSIFSLPVRLAALGTCPALPAPCRTGLPRPMTDGENNGIGAAAFCGIAGLLLGFYGLVIAFRRPVLRQGAPPVRKIPPMDKAAPAPAPEPAPAEAKAAPGPAEPKAAEEEPELPAHEEEELPELPPHESSSATT